MQEKALDAKVANADKSNEIIGTCVWKFAGKCTMQKVETVTLNTAE